MADHLAVRTGKGAPPNAWQEEAKLLPSDGAAGDRFGFSAAVRGDVAVEGTPYDDDGGDDSGSAYVFRFDGSTWTEEAKLRASEGAAGDEFGWPADIDGDRVALGAYRDDNKNGEDAGAAYVFELGACTKRLRLSAACRVNDCRRRLTARLKKARPCTPVTFRLNDDPCSDVVTTTNARGKVNVTYGALSTIFAPGSYRIEVLECGVNREIECQ